MSMIISESSVISQKIKTSTKAAQSVIRPLLMTLANSQSIPEMGKAMGMKAGKTNCIMIGGLF